MNRSLLLSICVCLCLAAAEAGAQAPPPSRPRDMVLLADGGNLTNVVVLSETPSEVTVDTTGDGKADRTLNQNEVKAITYDREPTDYRQAVALYGVSDYDKAMEGFRKASAAPGRRWVKDYSAYYLAMCLARKSAGDPTQRAGAIASFEALLKDPGNRWRDDARYQLGQIYLAAGDKAKAQTAFATLAASAHREEMKLTASVGLSDILMAEGKPAEALKGYNRVVTQARGKFEDLYAAATVGKAEAHTALGEFDKAGTFLQEILDTSKSRELRAKAHLALGDCRYAQAAAEKEPDKVTPLVKEALNNYLWVVVVYSNQKAEFAKSLYQAAQCWRELKEPAKARELETELTSKFPTSAWARKLKGR